MFIILEHLLICQCINLFFDFILLIKYNIFRGDLFMKENKCDCQPINQEVSDKARDTMPNIDNVLDLADFFKVMGDSTRLQILMALIQNEFCVSDLSYILNMSQSAISHQLKALKNAKLVRGRREGRIIYYSLDDDHIKDILAEALVHVLDC